MQYPLSFSKEDGDIVARSRDLPELLTAGKDMAEALELAEDALAVVLLAYCEKGLAIPGPSPLQDGETYVVVPAATAAKLAVINAFLAAGITKNELAHRMGVAETEARRVLDPNHGTKLEKLDHAARALGRRIVVGLAA